MRKPTRTGVLQSGNSAAYDKALASKEGIATYLPLLQLCSEMLDKIAEGEDVFLTIGATKRKDAFLLTLTWDKDPQFVASGNFADLASSASSLL